MVRQQGVLCTPNAYLLMLMLMLTRCAVLWCDVRFVVGCFRSFNHSIAEHNLRANINVFRAFIVLFVLWLTHIETPSKHPTLAFVHRFSKFARMHHQRRGPRRPRRTNDDGKVSGAFSLNPRSPLLNGPVGYVRLSIARGFNINAI